MNGHLTDEEILDLLAPGAEPEPRMRDHIEACPECRRRIEAERPLTALLSGLPRETDPPRDLWPELRAVIGWPGWMHHAVRAAAAVAIFVLGAAAGRALEPSEASREAAIPDEPLAAAAEVQRAGTAYVAAIARFRVIAERSPEPVVEQARDVTLAAVHGAAWELTRMRRDDATAEQIVSLVGEGRRGESSDGASP
ncbi:MAG TPA: hypothetical protein VFH11_03420 [Gemmatimonadota bacterium]|nr:hypothetical protein [Gemmatimonadota bacterium]